MIMDERGEFADATALSTVGTGLALVGDVIDTGGDGINDVDDMYLVIQISTAVEASGGAASVSFQLVSDAQAAIAADGSETLHFESASIPKATLVAGYRVCAVALPKGTYERYLGVQQNVVTNALTAGAINAFLTNHPETWRAFPDATN